MRKWWAWASSQPAGVAASAIADHRPIIRSTPARVASSRVTAAQGSSARAATALSTACSSSHGGDRPTRGSVGRAGWSRSGRTAASARRRRPPPRRAGRGPSSSAFQSSIQAPINALNSAGSSLGKTGWSVRRPCVRPLRCTGPSNIFDDLNSSKRPSPAIASVWPARSRRCSSGGHRLELADDLEVLVEHLLGIDPGDQRRDRQREDVAQCVLDRDARLGDDDARAAQALHRQHADVALEQDRQHLLLEAAVVHVHHVERHLDAGPLVGHAQHLQVDDRVLVAGEAQVADLPSLTALSPVWIAPSAAKTQSGSLS